VATLAKMGGLQRRAVSPDWIAAAAAISAWDPFMKELRT
jgi:uncharacterized membrane protein